jgi:flagellar hook-length control protein FliK
MDTLPVQNVIAPPAAAAAAGAGAPEDNNTANDTAAPAPRRFGALLALQLGTTLQVAGKKTPAVDAAADDKTGAEPGAAIATDALAGLTLPSLLPAVAPATQTIHLAQGANPDPRNVETTASSAVAAPDRHALPRAAADTKADIPQTTESAEPAHAAAGPHVRDTAEFQAAIAHAGEKLAHGADAAAPGAPPAQVAQLAVAPAPAAVAPAQAALEARVGTPDWNTELGQKIVWMIGDKQHVAEMRVNPPELGPLDIKLTVDGQLTTAVFTSPHGAVRDAVESALPRLREVLADSGIMLGNASVTADTPRDGQAFADQRPGARTAHPLAPDAGPAPALIRVTTSTRGLVDLFA